MYLTLFVKMPGSVSYRLLTGRRGNFRKKGQRNTDLVPKTGMMKPTQMITYRIQLFKSDGTLTTTQFFWKCFLGVR